MNLKLEMIKMLRASIPGVPQGFMLLFHRNCESWLIYQLPIL